MPCYLGVNLNLGGFTMKNIDIANGLIFQALDVSKDTFEDRLIGQKKIFLLQEMGVNIGYDYNWYVRGPYSPSLTNYIYHNLDMLKEQDFSKYTLQNNVQEKIDNINSLDKKKPESLSVPSWYELLASVLYICKKWEERDAFDCLKKYKPQYTQGQFDAAKTALQSLNIV